MEATLCSDAIISNCDFQKGLVLHIYYYMYHFWFLVYSGLAQARPGLFRFQNGLSANKAYDCTGQGHW